MVVIVIPFILMFRGNDLVDPRRKKKKKGEEKDWRYKIEMFTKKKEKVSFPTLVF